MAKGKAPKPPSTKHKYRSNIYTILAMASLLVLITGVAMLYWVNVDLTGWEQKAADPGATPSPLYLTKDPDK